MSEEQITTIKDTYKDSDEKIDRAIVKYETQLEEEKARIAEQETEGQKTWESLQEFLPSISEESSSTSKDVVFDENTSTKEAQVRNDESALEIMKEVARLSTAEAQEKGGKELSSLFEQERKFFFEQPEVTEQSNPPVETPISREMKSFDTDFDTKMTSFAEELKAGQEEQKKLDINSLNNVAREITNNINREVAAQRANQTQDIEKQLLLYKNANEICDVLLSFGCKLSPNSKRNEFRDKIKEIEDALKNKRETG